MYPCRPVLGYRKCNYTVREAGRVSVNIKTASKRKNTSSRNTFRKQMKVDRVLTSLSKWETKQTYVSVWTSSYYGYRYKVDVFPKPRRVHSLYTIFVIKLREVNNTNIRRETPLMLTVPQTDQITGLKVRLKKPRFVTFISFYMNFYIIRLISVPVFSKNILIL